MARSPQPPDEPAGPRPSRSRRLPEGLAATASPVALYCCGRAGLEALRYAAPAPASGAAGWRGIVVARCTGAAAASPAEGRESSATRRASTGPVSARGTAESGRSGDASGSARVGPFAARGSAVARAAGSGTAGVLPRRRRAGDVPLPSPPASPAVALAGRPAKGDESRGGGSVAARATVRAAGAGPGVCAGPGSIGGRSTGGRWTGGPSTAGRSTVGRWGGGRLAAASEPGGGVGTGCAGRCTAAVSAAPAGSAAGGLSGRGCGAAGRTGSPSAAIARDNGLGSARRPSRVERSAGATGGAFEGRDGGTPGSSTDDVVGAGRSRRSGHARLAVRTTGRRRHRRTLRHTRNDGTSGRPRR